MAMYPKFRDIHLYVGLAVLIPTIVIAATGVMLNHEKSLGLKGEYAKTERQRPDEAAMGVKPEGNAAKKQARRQKDETVKSPGLHHDGGDGTWTRHQTDIQMAMAAAHQRWGDMRLEKIELKDDKDYGLIVKVKAHNQSAVHGEELFWSIPDQAVVMWKSESYGGKKIGANGEMQIDWAKVVNDLHTGKIFGDQYGWLWSDITGVAIVALSVTGLVLYLIVFMKKRGGKRKAKPAAPAAATRREAAPAPAAMPVTQT